MKNIARYIMAGLAAWTINSSAWAAPEPVDPEVMSAFVDGAVKSLMAQNRSQSGVVVIATGEEVIFSKGYGLQDMERQVPVSPDSTLFRPGSTSKLFTWVSVMQLVEEGKLDLDADVNTYLDQFEIEPTFEKPVTLRHIMTHSAGFEDGGYGYLMVPDASGIMPLGESLKRYQPERVNPPGSKTAYSNYATALAGLIVANVSGLPFNDYVQQRILEPLGMHYSTFDEPLPSSLQGNMAKAYEFEGGGYVEKPFEIIANFGPAGGMSASGIDMITFARAILAEGEWQGKRILQPETVRTMLADTFSLDERLPGMSLGFITSLYESVPVIGHGGDTQWFHSCLGIDRQHQYSFFMSFSGSGGAAVRGSLLPLFYEEFMPAERVAPTPPEDFQERVDRYIGNYGFWRKNFSKVEKVLGMPNAVQVSPGSDNTLVVNLMGGSKEYAEVEKNLFRQVDPSVSLFSGINPSMLAFQENEGGEITGFVLEGMPFMSAYRLPFHETPNFNFLLLGVAVIVFLWVLLRRFFQRKQFAAMPRGQQMAIRARVYFAAINLLVMIVGAIAFTAVMENPFFEFPIIFKLWLLLPMLAVLSFVYLLYQTWYVWAGEMLSGTWARARYTFVTVVGLGVCWFYYFWNLLGFQYY